MIFCLCVITLNAQVSNFATSAFSRTSLDANDNWKPWSDWLPVTDGHFTIDRDNMRASLDIDSWGTHIQMQIDSTAESMAGQDITLFSFFCSTRGASTNQKQYNIEVMAYRKPGIDEIQFQHTIYLTDSYSSTKFLASYKEVTE